MKSKSTCEGKAGKKRVQGSRASKGERNKFGKHGWDLVSLKIMDIIGFNYEFGKNFVFSFEIFF